MIIFHVTKSKVITKRKFNKAKSYEFFNVYHKTIGQCELDMPETYPLCDQA